MLRPHIQFAGDGSDHLDAKTFVRLVRNAWLGKRELFENNDECSAAMAAELMAGLRGPAARWTQGQPDTVVYSFTRLSAGLVERFPRKNNIVKTSSVFNEIFSLKQESATIDQYLDHCREIFHRLPTDDANLPNVLIDAMIDGFEDRNLASIVGIVTAAKPGKNFEEMVSIIQDALGPKAVPNAQHYNKC